MLDLELIRLLNAKLDADFAQRDHALAKEVERTKNEMGLRGLGRSTAMIEEIASLFDREVLTRASITWEAFSHALKGYAAAHSNLLTEQVKAAITERVCLLAQDFNDQIARAAYLAGLKSSRNVDGVKRVALQHLDLNIELLSRARRVEATGVLLPNRTEKRVEHWVQADSLRTTADLDGVFRVLFDFPERNFFVFEQEDHRSAPLAEAVDRGDVLIEETELYYITEGPGLFKRIDPNTKSPAEKAVLASGPKYVRHKLSLGTRKRRELENLEIIRMQREANLNPLELKPNIFGFGIDLLRLPAWVRKLWLRLHPKDPAK